MVALVATVGMLNAQRTWAYDLNLEANDGSYKFVFTASTDATAANLVFLNADGTEAGKVAVSVVKGENAVELTVAQIPGTGVLNWAVELTGAAIDVATVLTDASDKYYYYLPQDVEVNNNPESDYFGTIYVAEPYAGASDGASAHSQTQKIGIYVYDAELNLENYAQGYVPSNVTVKAADKHNTLHRLVVHPLTSEVVFTQSVGAYVWAANPANLNAEAVNLIEGSDIAIANSVCFDENGVMYVFDAATTVVNGRNSLAADGHGGVWIGQNRGQLDAYNYLTHVNAAGQIDYEVNAKSADEIKAMFAENMNRGHIAYDAQRDVLAIGGGGKVTLLNAVYDENGTPTLTSWVETPMFNPDKPGWNVDGIAFDYAGDLYVVCASNERFYKYALPTATNTCTTPAKKSLTITKEGTGVENVTTGANTVKMVRNGQLVIIRDGKTFNMLGQEVK